MKRYILWLATFFWCTDFVTNRRVLLKHSQRALKVLCAYLKTGVSNTDSDSVPGGVIAVQTFDDFQNFNPHLHIITTDDGFYRNEVFIKGPTHTPKFWRLTDGKKTRYYDALEWMRCSGHVNTVSACILGGIQSTISTLLYLLYEFELRIRTDAGTESNVELFPARFGLVS